MPEHSACRQLPQWFIRTDPASHLSGSLVDRLAYAHLSDLRGGSLARDNGRHDEEDSSHRSSGSPPDCLSCYLSHERLLVIQRPS